METLAKDIEKAAQRLEELTRSAREEQARLIATDPAQRPSLQKMAQTVWINSREPIAWPTWPPGLVAKAKALVKKLVRRTLQWYIDPIVTQQNEFNQATLVAVRQLAQEVAELQAKSN